MITKKSLLWLLPLFLAFLSSKAQCIKDITYLINSPTPCFFVGTVEFDNPLCYDPFSMVPWKYTWKIRGADDGKLEASYDGMAFQHTFKKFGGYEFCLEIDKDGNELNGPEIVDCVTYTTCQFCGPTDISVDYLSCPTGKGCNIELNSSFAAENTVGLHQRARFVISYIPTVYEEGDHIFGEDKITVASIPNYYPEKGRVEVSAKLKIPYARGCYKVRLELDLEQDAGAHYHWGGPPCQQLEIWSDETFRCIGCINENEDCQASLNANKKTSESGTCDIFTCVELRESPDEGAGLFAAQNSFRLSPNPAGDVVHVDFPEDEKGFSVYLFNAMGQLMHTTSSLVSIDHFDLDTSTVPNGIYFLILKKEGRNIYSEKVMISK